VQRSKFHWMMTNMVPANGSWSACPVPRRHIIRCSPLSTLMPGVPGHLGRRRELFKLLAKPPFPHCHCEERSGEAISGEVGHIGQPTQHLAEATTALQIRLKERASAIAPA
jgi:hypothetical protein